MEGQSIPQCQDLQREDQEVARQNDQAKGVQARDKVLLFNSRVKLFGHGKLRTKWEGPYTIVDVASHGAITLKDDEDKTFKVNGHHLKIFLEPDNKEYDVINFIEET